MRIGTLCLAASLLLAPNASPQQWGTRLDGKPLPELAPANTRAVVLFFVATDCPISNRTFPEMTRLREEFTPRGVRFYYVYPNPTDHPTDIAQHQQAFDRAGDPIQDPTAALAHLTHAIVTPEIAILIPSPTGWRAAYTGRIDNRFVRLGLERPAATEHFAEAAIAAILADKPPTPASGTPVGCAIMNPRAK